MLDVRFRRDSRNRLSSVVAEGHVGLADHGEDIVCAGVSAVLQAAWFGLLEHARVPVDGHARSGDLSFRWPAETRERPDVAAIVRTAELAVRRIAEQFPQHIVVHDEREGAAGAG